MCLHDALWRVFPVKMEGCIKWRVNTVNGGEILLMEGLSNEMEGNSKIWRGFSGILFLEGESDILLFGGGI